MCYWKSAKILILCFCFSCFSNATTLPDWMSVSGFASTAAAKSDNSAPYYYTRNIGDEWCYDCDTIAGIQLDLFPTDWLYLSAQGVKRPTDDFSSPELEWAYASVEFTDIRARIGRLRSPSFMYSQVVFVNQAYPWARLPAEVYDTTSGFTRYDGIDVLYTAAITDEILIQIQPYAAFPSEIRNNELNQIYYNLKLKELYGLRVDFEATTWNAYLNYFKTRVYIESVTPEIPTFTPGIPFPTGMEKITADINADTWSYGIRYDWEDYTFVFEGTTGKESAWGGFFSAIYHYDKWSPYIVYGKRTESDAVGRSKNKSDSVSLGLRYDILPNLSIVGEWHHTKIADGGDYRGSLTAKDPQTITDSSANIYTLGINYSFSF